MEEIKQVKLISDEEREEMKKNKGEFLTLMAEYKEILKQEEKIKQRKEELKTLLCPMLREKGEVNKSGNTFNYNNFGYKSSVSQRRNIKFVDENALINYCKQAGYRDLIVVDEKIDRKRFTDKWDKGSLPVDEISCFINIDYVDTLSVKGEENLNYGN